MESAASSSLFQHSNKPISQLTSGEIASIIYHDIFDYPLTYFELSKWKAGKEITSRKSLIISYQNGFYFAAGKEGIVYKRLIRERISERKLKTAKDAVRIFGFIPTIKMVGITGALAMGNAAEESDIDLLIITKKGTLWTTRLISYLVTWLLGIKTRKPNDRDQKDKLCLNMWLSESALTWPKRDRNVYTSHEIAQTVPLINKNQTYEKFLYKNIWVKDWWPNVVKIENVIYKTQSGKSFLSVFEPLTRTFQYWYMRRKMTREVATSTRAIFHPNNWGEFVLSRLSS